MVFPMKRTDISRYVMPSVTIVSSVSLQLRGYHLVRILHIQKHSG